MAIIKTTCPEHGDVDLRTVDVTCVVFEYPNGNELDQYRFQCPIGSEIVVESVPSRSVDLLIASGVEVDPVEMSDQLIPQGLSSLTNDLLIDYIVDLHSPSFDIKLQQLDGNP